MIKLIHRIPNQHKINTNHHKSSQNQFKASQFNKGSQKHGKTQPSDLNSIEILNHLYSPGFWINPRVTISQRNPKNHYSQEHKLLELLKCLRLKFFLGY